MAWKAAERRKPLLLQGARQTGKTYVLKHFGERYYDHYHYFNFEQQPALAELFAQDLRPARILKALEAIGGAPIVPRRDLLVFDEIQACPAALTSLKYFQEEAGQIHLAAAGSLLGVWLGQGHAFPVGKVNMLHLYPMSFGEFLGALGRQALRSMIDEVGAAQPWPRILHEELVGLLRQYYIVGGMPEAVQAYSDGRQLSAVRQIHREIGQSYLLDFAKHASAAETEKLTRVWQSVPTQLARENRKFIFSAVRKSARARDLEGAIIWLERAGLIHRVFAVESAAIPLAAFADRSCFKAYALDVGLLATMADIPLSATAAGEHVFQAYKGAFVENFVAQHLAAAGRQPLYYWRSKGGTAELDFLLEHEGQVLPLEVKAGINARSKSLRSFDQQFRPPRLLRSTLLNLRHDGNVTNLPLYAIEAIDAILGH